MKYYRASELVRAGAPTGPEDYRILRERTHREEKPVHININWERIKRRYLPTALALCGLFLWTGTVRTIVRHNTQIELRAEYEAQYEQKLEEYRAEQARQAQAEYFLSGDASREAFINQEIDAAARLAAKMSNDTQKGGIICNALARVMSRDYPDTMREVIAQPQQWMLYDEGNKFTARDREIAEKILRAYYEDGIIPTGLTEDYVYGSWSQSDYVLRNTWDYGPSTRTWRYQG